MTMSFSAWVARPSASQPTEKCDRNRVRANGAVQDEDVKPPTSPDAVRMGRRVWFDRAAAHTPRGVFALRRTRVTTLLVTTQRRYTPGWAIAAMIVFVWALPFSLLFLLIRRSREERQLRVTFSDGAESYTLRVKIRSDEQRNAIMRQVAYMRSVHSSDQV
jgi:hypothetical protein